MTDSPSSMHAPDSSTSATVASTTWGRIDEAGEVFVTTPSGERHIGSWHVGKPEDALTFFAKRYDDLTVQINLLATRVDSGKASYDDASAGIDKLRESLANAQAIGDLGALDDKLTTIEQSIERGREQKREQRAHAREKARIRKEEIVVQAESIAEGSDWRSGADTLRTLLEEWKSLPRLSRSDDDTLWHRFSSARTSYTRRRKAHFAERAKQRDTAKVTKEKLIREAEKLSTSTDWAATSRRYRELMSQWKAAGPAPRDVEDTLWSRFQAAREVFFSARKASQNELDEQHQANLVTKQSIAAEAEALLPITNIKNAKRALRSLQDRWDSVGHVPRDAKRDIEKRMRAVEDAVRDAEQAEWRQNNPARSRAAETVDQLNSVITELENKAAAARERGDERALREAEEALAARRVWLEQAEQALTEFSI